MWTRTVLQPPRVSGLRPPASCLRAVLLITFFSALLGCREADKQQGRAEAAPPIVATTLFPIGDITAAIAGPAAEVTVILPAGASPTTFEPPPALVRRLAEARLVIAVGAGVDAWAGDLASASGAQLLSLTEGLPLKEAGPDGEGGNPHVWLDPIRVRDDLLPRITEALVRIAPASEAEIRERSARYRDSLTALDQELRATLSSLESRVFVATHAAWPYFAERYDVRQLGTLYPAPGRELSPRELAALVDRARESGVRAVFTEPQLGEQGARALAEELEASVGMLDPLGGPLLPGRDSYFALLRYNAHQFAQVLGGRRG